MIEPAKQRSVRNGMSSSESGDIFARLEVNAEPRPQADGIAPRDVDARKFAYKTQVYTWSKSHSLRQQGDARVHITLVSCHHTYTDHLAPAILVTRATLSYSGDWRRSKDLRLLCPPLDHTYAHAPPLSVFRELPSSALPRSPLPRFLGFPSVISLPMLIPLS